MSKSLTRSYGIGKANELVEFISAFNSGFVVRPTGMIRAIAVFFNLLVLIILFRIFAPGLAGGLVELATNVVMLANEAVVQLRSHDMNLPALNAGPDGTP